MLQIEPQLKVANDDGREAPLKTSFSTNEGAMLWFHIKKYPIRPLKISKKDCKQVSNDSPGRKKNVKIIIADFKCLKK